MNFDVVDTSGKRVGTLAVPTQFLVDVRPDLISRVLRAVLSWRRQPFGSALEAGQQHSAKLSRRRRDYKTSYGHGMSRVPRKTMWRRGRQFGWVGAVAPGTVGGRRAHPPKVSSDWVQKVNAKERRYALRSALSSTLASQRVAVVRGVEGLSHAKDVSHLLSSLSVPSASYSHRAGRGRLRGRAYHEQVGPLFVVASPCPLRKSAANISGASVVQVRSLHAGYFMKDAQTPRHVIWSAEAVEVLSKEKLYL